jgi:hypothetical protein
LLPAYFGVLLLALFGSPAIANHTNDAHANLIHVANRNNTAGPEKTRTFTDLAFWGRILAEGTYDGFRLFDISNPSNPKLLVDFLCFGGQGDVSLYKAGSRLLLFRSTDTPQQGNPAEPNPYGPNPDGASCDSRNNTGASRDNQHWEGIRVLDITNPAKPKLLKSVYTDCGSHTHTVIRDTKNNRAIIYNSSYPISPTAQGEPCHAPHAKISVIVVPDSAPQNARVHHYHPIIAQPTPEGGLGDAAPGVIGCHDITVFTDPNVKEAAAACLTEGQLWDIRNPLYPCTVPANTPDQPPGSTTPEAPRNQGDCTTHTDNPSVELYHSSAYTNDARVVLWGDEQGAALAPGCNGEEDSTGNIWFHKNVEPGTDVSPLLGRYMFNRPQLPQYCTLHNFNVIPIENNQRYIGVSSAYEGGTTVFDFTGVKDLLADPPGTSDIVATEIAYWDSTNGDGNGHDDVWSSYWHNNFIWASGGLGSARGTTPAINNNRGLDVFKLLVNGQRFTADTEPFMNPQTQEDLEENEGREGEND